MDNIKVIFFDLYNTLIFIPGDTNPYGQFFNLCNIMNDSELKKAKHIILTEEITSFDLIAKRLGINCVNMAQGISKKMNEEISRAALFNETMQVLLNLKQRGLKLCIISNLATPYKKPVFDLGLNRLIDEIIFSCELGYKKPDKEIFSLACKRMCIQPDQGLMIGDSVKSDYHGAVNAGMNAILLNREAVKRDIPNILSLSELIPKLL